MKRATVQRMSGREGGRSKAMKGGTAVKVVPRPDCIATVLSQWSEQRPGLDLGPLGMFIALAQVYWLTAPRIERLMADHGITRGIFDVLTTLRRAGAPHTLAPKQLAHSLLLSGAGLTGRLDRLEEDGLVLRLPDPRDGRGLSIRLMPKGLRLVDRILPELIRLEAGLAAGLSGKQTAQLTQLLDRWAGSVQASGKKALLTSARRPMKVPPVRSSGTLPRRAAAPLRAGRNPE